MLNQSSTGRRSRRILALSVLLFALGVAALTGGAILLYYNIGTDSEGYAMSPVYEVRTSSNAFALWVAPMKGTSFDWLGKDNIAQTKWVVKAVGAGKQVFAGWAEASDGANYLGHFTYETPDQNWYWHINPYYAKIDIVSTKIVGQGSPIRAPSAESFWLDSDSASDVSTVYWNPSWEQNAGMKMIILMNADGSSGVNADLQLGFKVPILTWLPYLLLSLGIVFCLGGYLLFRRKSNL